MSQEQIDHAVTTYLASGGTVQQGPTLYADGCNGEDDMSEESGE
jgi:hypothetical protein